MKYTWMASQASHCEQNEFNIPSDIQMFFYWSELSVTCNANINLNYSVSLKMGYYKRSNFFFCKNAHKFRIYSKN